jgi:hypothetical protein
MDEVLARLRQQVADRGAGRAVVIDLDTVRTPSPELAHKHLEALLAAAAEHVVAVAAGRDCSHAAYADACESLGVTAMEADPVANGADIALLAYAQALAEVGVDDFVVISPGPRVHRAAGSGPGRDAAYSVVAGRLATTADDVELVDLAKSKRDARSRATHNARRRRTAARAAARAQDPNRPEPRRGR